MPETALPFHAVRFGEKAERDRFIVIRVLTGISARAARHDGAVKTRAMSWRDPSFSYTSRPVRPRTAPLHIVGASSNEGGNPRDTIMFPFLLRLDAQRRLAAIETTVRFMEIVHPISALISSRSVGIHPGVVDQDIEPANSLNAGN
jgi:hypothetical protein